ncbi:MAG: IclR family transcriptional regulator, partial [Deinococcota bacterium]
MATTTERRVIGSLQRAFDILDLFTVSSPELGITEIAQRLELHKSTASGLVYTLETYGYLEQNPENRKYHLGLKLMERASVLLKQLEIRKIALPYLKELRNWSNESVNLAIRDHVEVVYIERIVSDQGITFQNFVGKRGWVHSAALGKAMLAPLPEDKVRKLLESYTLEPITEHTLSTVDDVMADLAVTRERGYALDDQENELGGRCVSAAIFNHLNQPIA